MKTNQHFKKIIFLIVVLLGSSLVSFSQKEEKKKKKDDFTKQPWVVDAKKGKTGPVVLDKKLQNENVGIGVKGKDATEKLTVDGIIYSVSGGFKFPDNTVQTTALTGVTVVDGVPTTNNFHISGTLQLGDSTLFIDGSNGEFHNSIYVGVKGPKFKFQVLNLNPINANSNARVGIGTRTVGPITGFSIADSRLTISGDDKSTDDFFNVRKPGLKDSEDYIIVKNTANEGAVGIGTDEFFTGYDPALPIGPGGGGEFYKLSVKGKLRAHEVKVYTGWSDFVFDEDYKLRSLSKVEEFIKNNGHLPDIPSGEIIEKEGVFLGNMQMLMMQKIEELTLYSIEMNKKLIAIEKENSALKSEMEILKRKKIVLSTN